MDKGEIKDDVLLVDEKGIFWLRHHRVWFGFENPVFFMESEFGGYFADLATKKSVYSNFQNGFTLPLENLSIVKTTPVLENNMNESMSSEKFVEMS